MARPRSSGIYYFPFETRFNARAEGFIALFGNDGLAFLVRLWQSAYQNENGQVELCGVLRRRTLVELLRITEERLQAMIEAAIELNLVDGELWKSDKILTSSGIQKRLGSMNKEKENARLRAAKRYANNSTPQNHVEPPERALPRHLKLVLEIHKHQFSSRPPSMKPYCSSSMG